MSVLLTIDMLRSGPNLVLALHPINPFGELGYFHHLTQCSRQTNLTRKRAKVEQCYGDTNIVVLKAEKTKSVH